MLCSPCFVCCRVRVWILGIGHYCARHERFRSPSLLETAYNNLNPNEALSLCLYLPSVQVLELGAFSLRTLALPIPATMLGELAR